MPVSFTLNRTTSLRPLTGDADGDGYADAGDVLRHTLTITNTGNSNATNVVLNDLLGGSTETGLMNISPIAFDDAFTAVGNTALRVGGAANIGTGPSSQVAGNLLTNDFGSTTIGAGALAGDDVTGFTVDTVNNALTAGGGRYSIFADGSFNYISEAGDQGTDSFTYTIRDAGINGTAGDGDDTTSTATVTITITGQVWYVDSAAAGGGTGTSANPFNSITALQSANVDGTGDFVYVKGNATGQLVMETGEHLIGQGASLDVATFHLADAGTRSTITNTSAGFAVTLAGGGTGNNEIAGINITSTGGTANHALTGTSFGNLTINNTTVDASGQGVILSTGAIQAGSAGLVSTDSDGGANNVSLTGIAGTLALGTGALSGATGTAFNVSGGTVSTTYSGNISQASASQALLSVSGGHATGTLTFSTGTLSATNGTGLQFDNADGNYNFNGTNTLNGGDAGVDIVNGSSGNFSFSTNSSITNPTGIGFNVNGGNGNIDYNGTISHNTNAQAISVQNHLGGLVSFDGTVSSTGASDGINLAINTGATINFTNTLTINTSGSGTIGFNATGGGTVTATGTGNTINSGAGIGLNVVNTNIGANDLHFDSISTNGASSGIVLNNTGTSASFGGLIITGTGTNDSGGSILNSTDDGIKLTSARDVSLTQMRIFNSTNNNIDANGVTNLTLVSLTSDQTGATNFLGNNITTMSISGSTFDHSGNAANEHGVFITGLFGINSVTNTDFHRSSEVQFRVLNTTATVAQGGVAGDILTMSGVTFADHSSAFFGDSIQINADQSANFHFIMNNSSGVNSVTGGIDGILINASSGGDIDVDIANTTVSNTSGPGINFNPVGTGSRVWFDVNGNTVTNPGSTGINATAIGNDAGIEGFIRNNTINQGATGNGITIVVEGDGDNATRPTATLSVSNNTISGVQNGSIINAQARVGGILNLTLNDNHGNINNALNLEGIFVQAGSSSPTDNDADTQNIVRLNMLNNDISVGALSGQEDYRMQVRGTSIFELQDFTGNGNNATTTDEVNWIITTKANSEFLPGDNPPEVQISHTLTGAVTGAFSASSGAIPTPNLPTPLIASGPPPSPSDNDVVVSNDDTGGLVPPPTGVPPVVPSDPTPNAPAVVDDGILSQAELNMIVNAAIDRWAAAGASAGEIAAMRAVVFTVADLQGLTLGSSSAGQITLDSNAAGFNWFVDATPGEDSEYSGQGTALHADRSTPAGVRIDLLTTVMHELGHQIGLGDSYLATDRADLMYGTIDPGERRLPDAQDVALATGTPNAGTDFVLSPVNLGTIPAGRTVTVQWDSTVNAFTNMIVPTFSNTSTVTYSDGATNGLTATSNANVLGPTGVPSLTNVVLDSLTLGNLVFLDANNNGMFDGADTGINGVALTLFADTNANGVFDSGIDAQIATTTTAGGGIYSFANLAPGNYIVRVDAANFGGVLSGRVTAIGGNDPDDNANDDDNGVNAAGGIVVSQAITLSQNGEPNQDASLHNDINNTLDFGFVELNNPPVNTKPGTQTINEDATLTFSGGTAISVSDPDAGAGNLTVTLSVLNGQLTLSGTAGLTFAPGGGDGTDDTSMTFSGTQAAINAALNGLLYETTLDYNGSDTLTIVTNDNGNIGADPGTSGGANDEQDTDTVTINITAVADLVADTATVGEDSGANNLNLLGNDTFENPGRSITSVTQGLHGFVAINDNNTVGVTSDDFVVYTPVGDYNGTDSFTYTVTSGGVTETGTVNVTISAVVDIANDTATVDEDSGTTTIDVIANDSFENGGFSITAVTQGLNGTVTIIDGPDADLNPDFVTYTPSANYNGPDSFTYTVTSGGVTEVATVNVTVTAVNDAPVFTGLDGTPTFTENGAAVVLDSNATVSDPELTGGNYNLATLTLARSGGASAQDVFGGTGGAGLTLTGPGNVNVNGTTVGTYVQSGGTLTITFNSNATQALVNAALQGITYSNSSDTPLASAVIAYVFNDGNTGLQGSGGALGTNGSVTVSITAADDPAVAVNDPGNATPENATVNIAVLANDTDVDGPPPSVAMVNGTAISVGSPVTLGSGAKVFLNLDGSLTYDPNGQFGTLTNTSGGETGAVNTSAPDSFTYTLAGTGGGTATVSVTVNGVANAADHLNGDGTDNTITGTANGDYFDLSQGGNDNASGLGGDDGFFFGAAFTAADTVDGGAGTNDQIGLQGNYTGGNALVLGATTITGIEAIVVLPGFSYNITTNDANVAPGGVLNVQATRLAAGQSLTFNGAAEHDGRFMIFGGNGNDNFTGGDGNDGFYFGPGQYTSSDVVNGGAGTNDQLALDGDYTITLGGNLTGIEVIVLLRGPTATPNHFNVTAADTLVAAGQTITIFGLQVTTDITFNGSGEHDGAFKIYGGSGNDSFTGSDGSDWIFGGGGGDTMTGGAGADTFYYDAASQSTSLAYDKIIGFDDSADTIDLPFAVTGFATPASGNLSTASFDSDLANAFTGLTSHQAGMFTATGGTLSGHTFLVIDADGNAGYQAGSDYVIEIASPITPIDNPAIFV